MSIDKTAEKVRWACRRGMLELDLFLVPFFEQCYPTLNSSERETFQQLLNATDPELLKWLMNKAIHEDSDCASLIERIRAFRLHTSQHSSC